MKKKSLSLVFLLLMAPAMIVAGCNKAQEKKVSPPPELGQPAPDFTLRDTTGKVWKLSDLKGQVVFVNFWATWCPPCREEMPAMQKLFEAMPKDRFKMLAVLSNDDPAVAVNFAAKGGFTFPILVDPSSEAGQAYGLTGVPETYIVDKQGILRQKYLGPRYWDSEVAQKMLRDYINR